jgi:DNA-directed RNA polymerase specialized sigma24 family protein
MLEIDGLKNGAVSFILLRWVPKPENAIDDRELVQLSEALDELAKAEPELAHTVDLKFFCGFAFTEIAAMSNISERTAQRQWEKARIYLHRKIRSDLEI